VNEKIFDVCGYAVYNKNLHQLSALLTDYKLLVSSRYTI